MPDKHKPIIRNVLEVVRCQAMGGACVPSYNCAGDGKLIKRCPHYGGKEDGNILCHYHITSPVRVNPLSFENPPRKDARLYKPEKYGDHCLSVMVTVSEETPLDFKKTFNIIQTKE